MGSNATWLTDSAFDRISRLTWVIIAGATSYFAALWMLGFRLKDFSRQHI
jgi:putative peptidoglycan lipid II flippase